MNSVVLNSVLTLFLLIAVGFVVEKKKLISEKFNQDVCSILLKIAIPAAVISSMVRPYETSILIDSGKIFLFTFIFHIFCMITSYFVTKTARIPRKEKGVWIFVSSFSNNGLMGFPLAYAIFGNNGLFLAAVSNIISNILIFSVGVKILTIGYESDSKIQFKKVFINNINIAVIVGIIIYTTQIKLSQPIMDSIKYVGSITTPLSMFIVGISIAKGELVEMFKDYKLYILSTVRILLVPFLGILVMQLLPHNDGSIVSKVFVLLLAMPAPSTTTIISEQYKANSILSSKSIFMTTFLSIVTIPIVMMFI